MELLNQMDGFDVLGKVCSTARSLIVNYCDVR